MRYRFGLALVMVIAACVLAFIVKGPRPAFLAPSLRDENPAVRMAALRKLDNERDVGRLIEALADENADIRLVAAQKLGGGKQSVDCRIEALMPMLKDPHAGVRREAAESLGRFGSESSAVLCAALKDEDPRVRAGAALALDSSRRFKSPCNRSPDEILRIKPLLYQLLRDENAEARRNAISAICCLGKGEPPSAADLESVQSLLKDADPFVREHALRLLSSIESVKNDPHFTETVTAALQLLLKDENEVISSEAERALENIEKRKTRR